MGPVRLLNFTKKKRGVWGLSINSIISGIKFNSLTRSRAIASTV